MIGRISANRRKDIAFVLYVIMVFEMLLPVYAHASGGGRFVPGIVWSASYGKLGRHLLSQPFAGVPLLTEYDGTGHPKDVPAQQHDLLLQGSYREEDEEWIDGPSQPEMRQFAAVGTNNMVDLFTGDFSYNIPLLDVGGYPVNISYSGNVTMDQEASWVGLGWNINPGAVTRNTRGIPDDFNGTDKIIKTSRTKPLTIAGGSLGVGFEMAGLDMLRLNLSTGGFYHSRNGWGTEISINPSINIGKQSYGNLNGGASVGLGLNLNSQEGVGISPSFSYDMSKKDDKEIGGGGSIATNYNSRQGLSSMTLSAHGSYKEPPKSDASKDASPSYGSMSNTSSISFVRSSAVPSISMPYTSINVSFNLGIGPDVTIAHFKGNLNGYYTRTQIKPNDQTQRKPAYGYLYYSKAGKNKNGLYDINRDKEVAYRDKPLVQNIAIPSYTYDAFTFTGEGNSGMFRAYRGDVGHSFDHYMRSKSQSLSGGLDLGIGAGVKWGGNFSYVRTATTNGAWNFKNAAIKRLNFTDQSGWHEPVYFRNVGELTVSNPNYLAKLGDDKLVKLAMFRIGGSKSPVFGLNASFDVYNSMASKTGEIAIADNISTGGERERRNQVISYYSADEAVQADNAFIISYDTNYFHSNCLPDPDRVDFIKRNEGIRKGHHLSMINMLNGDGKRYEYGIPVYNIDNREVTYSLRRNARVDSANRAYSSAYPNDIDNITKENLGYTMEDESDRSNAEGYFMRQITPPYSHSFLLTGIFSPDYMDVTGDGPTEDDLGDGIKFNYSRVYSEQRPYLWRTPMNPILTHTVWDGITTKHVDSANGNYDEGLKTDYRDDKASYVAGSKEIWYVNSIESKTMIATFWVGKRGDAASQVKELGGNDYNKQLLYLKEIRLYSKADFARQGVDSAKPIKTVHFEYDYSLCPNYPLNDASGANSGKLSLKKIWFTYNRNEKGQQNPYRFFYRNNQPYQYQAADNWGNYKDKTDNPGGLSNRDFPYPIYNEAKAAGKEANIAPWALDSLILPSGSSIKVSYENDSYGFVQNKRALQLFQIFKLGKTSSLSTADSLLYEDTDDDNDHRYVFVKVPYKVYSKKELFSRYLEGLKYIYFRLNVKMPDDPLFDINNKRYEFVKLYTKVDEDNYGIADAADGIIWFKVEGTERKGSSDKGNYSPLTKAAIQFLRTNVPMKAFPGSAFPADQGLKLTSFAAALVGSFGEISTVIRGFHGKQKSKGACKEVDLNTSFVRLNNPELSKIGGGYRVKRVVIHDNWDKMTGQRQSKYGQEYHYTTTHTVGGKKVVISSGVASYEPLTGGEENPFRFPIENYNEQAALLGPVNTMYVEGPLMESFYPSASVGYRKVTVKSINNKNVKSLTGYDETCFYTSYDYPVIEYHTPIADGFNKFQTPPSLLNPFKCVNIKRLAFSQGFKIELNDMNGKMRSQASYSAFDSIRPISSTEYFYKSVAINGQSKRLDNKVTVIDTMGHVSNAQLGRDIELVSDFREQESNMFSGGFNANSHVFTISVFPLFIASFLKFPQFDLNVYQAAAVNKVINRHAILDSVVVIDKGSRVSTENLAYDALTSEVLLTRTWNEFDDPIYNMTMPAHWAYDRMGQAYKNIGISLVDSLNNGVIAHPANEGYFVPGDEVIASKRADSTGVRLWVTRTKNLTGVNDTIYQNPITEYPGQGPSYSGLRFLTREGAFYHSKGNVTMKIVRSGRRNQMTFPVGSISMLANPIVGNTLNIEPLNNVVNISAVEFKEDWKVKNRYWKIDGCNQLCNCPEGYAYDNIKDKCIKVVKDTTSAGSPILNSCATRLIQHSVYGVKIYKLSGTTYVPDESLPGLGSYTSEATHNVYKVGDNYWCRTSSNIDSTGILNRVGLWACNADGSDFNGSTAMPPMNEDVGYVFTFQVPQTKTYYIGVGGDNGYKIKLDCEQIVAKATEDVVNFQSWHVFPKVISKGWHVLELSGKNAGFLATFGAEVYDNTAMDIVNSTNGSGIKRMFSTAWYRGKPLHVSTSNGSYCSGGNCLGVDLDGNLTCNRYQDTSRICYTAAPVGDGLDSINPYVLGLLGNYRPSRSYVYYRDRKEQASTFGSTNIRTYGTVDSFYAFWQFNNGWIRPSSGYQANWVWNSENTQYDRKGMSIETRDPLGRYTAGQYAYNNTVPINVSQNSKSRESAFDSFEDYYFNQSSCQASEPCDKKVLRHFDWSAYRSKLQDTVRHTGMYAMKVAGTDTAYTDHALDSIANDNKPLWLRLRESSNPKGIMTDLSSRLPVFSPTYGDSMILSCWVREQVVCDTGTYQHTSIKVSFLNQSNVVQQAVDLLPSGIVIDGWQRIEAMVKIPANGSVKMRLTLKSASGYTSYFDDLRLHPYHATAKSFVYDPISMRLMAELDESNFASFYEYDDDGTLVRVKKETERGIKTIKETRSSLMKN